MWRVLVYCGLVKRKCIVSLLRGLKASEFAKNQTIPICVLKISDESIADYIHSLPLLKKTGLDVYLLSRRLLAQSLNFHSSLNSLNTPFVTSFLILLNFIIYIIHFKVSTSRTELLKLHLY